MDISLLLSVLAWGMLVGVVFSAIGAAGGILTSFGLITLFHVADPNALKPMTQLVVLATALVFVPGYLRRGAIVPSLGVILGVGGVVGAWAGSTVSTLYLSDMSTFRPLFGVLTLGVAAQIGWKLYRHWRITRSPGHAVEDSYIGPVSKKVVRLGCMCFQYGETRYWIPILSPLFAGAGIAFTASIFGVGGGFLLVPYLASLLGMPMYIIPATAAIAVFMSLVVSVGNFINLGAPVDGSLLIPLIIGAVVGALIGPAINKRVPNVGLQAAMAVIVTVIGLKYLLS